MDVTKVNNNNKRSGLERRVANQRITFPFRDKNGIIIARNRRTRCDRRASGLEVTESNMSQEDFYKYSNTSKG